MLEFEVRGIKSYLKRLQAISNELDSLEDFYRGPAVRVMKRAFADIFRGEGATRRTQRWKPHSSSTRARRARSGGRGKILWDTGRLRASYVSNPSVHVSRAGLRIGSNLPYARYHEQGTRHIPARPVVAYAQELSGRRLQIALNKYLRGKL